MTPRSAGTRSALLILLTFAACGHDGSGPSPAVTHLYVANDGHSNILAFALPLTAASLPAETTATDTGRKPVGIAVDGSGNVYICPESGFLSVFHQPLSAASQPADSVDLHATSCAYIAIGPDGRLYVADQGNWILAFTLPITTASVPDTVATGTQDALGVAFDTAGRLYASGGAKGVQVYGAPYTSAPLFSVDTLLTAIFGIAVDRSGRLYAADNNNQKILIFNPPLSATSTVADSITSGVTGGNGIAIGPDGRLYLATGASLLVFDPPFSHASAPTVTVPITSGLFVALGIAIGK